MGCTSLLYHHPMLDKVAIRFFDKVLVGDGCWEWQGTKVGGYGKFRLDGRKHFSHRLSFEHFNGEIPEGLSVCHSCDNPSCVNPKHLWLGSHTDNMRDMVAKGRHVMREQNGEANLSAKLSAVDVLAIRADPRIQKDIAKDYGIRQSAVSRIKRKQRWGHL